MLRVVWHLLILLIINPILSHLTIKSSINSIIKKWSFLIKEALGYNDYELLIHFNQILLQIFNL